MDDPPYNDEKGTMVIQCHADIPKTATRGSEPLYPIRRVPVYQPHPTSRPSRYGLHPYLLSCPTRSSRPQQCDKWGSNVIPVRTTQGTVQTRPVRQGILSCLCDTKGGESLPAVATPDPRVRRSSTTNVKVRTQNPFLLTSRNKIPPLDWKVFGY